MVKKRIVPVLLWDEFGCVKGKRFKPDRRIGPMMQAIRVMERRQIDELLILDIAATPSNRGPRFEEIKEFTSELSCPVTVGGGIRSLEDIRLLLASGADKVAICTAAITVPELIQEAAEKFGKQAIVGVLDVSDGKVVTNCGRRELLHITPQRWALLLEEEGCGEILVTSVDRDGTMEGYDYDLISEIAYTVDVPVIANGGCYGPDDMEKAFHVGADAVAAGALFAFTEHTPKSAAQYLGKQGIPVRLI